MNSTEFVGLSEIADLALPPVTKQAVANWRHRYEDFPKPVQTLQSGPVFSKELVEHWLAQHQNRAPQVISFINLKGGVGKTTTSIAVAEVLAMDHRKHVLFIDLDPQTNATINLIGEEAWKKRNDAGLTLAQLFKDKLNPHLPPKFKIEEAVIRGVSKVDGGISRLELLPSSIDFITVQEKIRFAAVQDEQFLDPEDILRQALLPILERYDFVIIDCPPSLGVVTKNGLRFSTHYVIPTIPDIVSTWGIFQIVNSIDSFSNRLGRPVKPIGIVASKVNGQNTLHTRMRETLRLGRLFEGKETDLKQPPLFEHYIKEGTDTARGADYDANVVTLKHKYGTNIEAFQGLAKEVMQKCSPQKN